MIPLDKFSIDPADEGLLFGRGVWESTRTFDGTPWLWPLHLERLTRSAEILHIDLAPARLPDEAKIAAHVRSLTNQDVIVRLNVTAGRPGKPGLVWMSTRRSPRARVASAGQLPEPGSKGTGISDIKDISVCHSLANWTGSASVRI